MRYDTGEQEDENKDRTPHRVRIPGFISDEELGLGDVIKQMTSAFGIRTCNKCEARARKLNQWLVFFGDPHR